MVEDDDSLPRNPARRRLFFAGGVLTLAAFALPILPGNELVDDLTSPVDKAVGFIDTLALTRMLRGVVRHNWVRRWDRDVDVRFWTEAPQPLIDELDTTLEALSDWTGLRFMRAEERSIGRGVIDIYVRSGADINDEFGGGARYCNTHSRGFGGSMRFARIDISQEHTSCLRHELMHALGFANHWDEPFAHPSMPSVMAPFGSSNRSPEYSEWDELAIRTLYDPALPPGTRRQEALEMIRQHVTKTLGNLA
ncbi:MAG: DUF2927 domain-containing protein [Alphaproteobacteria bacterium]|jgi:hypothetical protein